jgi:hypothetical protein
LSVREPRLVYRPRPDATPEVERVALAQVYRFVLDCWAKRREASSESDGRNDAAIASDTEEVVRHVDQRPDIT